MISEARSDCATKQMSDGGANLTRAELDACSATGVFRKVLGWLRSALSKQSSYLDFPVLQEIRLEHPAEAAFCGLFAAR
jgi:hypothetical protein